MQKLHQRDERLSEQIQSAIDAGKDVEESAPVEARRKNRRVYRKTVRFTDEEALQVALDALRAYFVEQPLFVRSAAKNFTLAAVDASGQPWSTLPAQEDKRFEGVLEIELQTETRISQAEQQTFPLKPASDMEIEEQKAHVSRLAELFSFREG